MTAGAAARRLRLRDQPRRPPRRVRIRRIAAFAAIIVTIPGLISFLSAMAQPSNTSLSIRGVEWLRANGARSLVDEVENVYYSLNAPSKGGPPLRSLPKQSGVASSPTPPRRVHLYRPPRIVPVIHPALPGEGIWHATFARGGSNSPVLITSYRPEPAYPQLIAGVAWINQSRTSIQLYPGRDEPAVAMPSRGPMEVPPSRRGKLVATFNSAFKLADSGGGFTYDGHTYAPLRDGLATITRFRNGSVNIIDWHGGLTAGRNVVYARQNLPLIVDHGRPNPNLSNGPEWGATLGNAVQVWRSAVGIDSHGDLLYAVANYQTVSSLAQIMIHAGAVRAMQLDINAYWPSFITYRFPGARDPANLLPDMVRSPYRYLTPDDRDFFAVYLKRAPSVRHHPSHSG